MKSVLLLIGFTLIFWSCGKKYTNTLPASALGSSIQFFPNAGAAGTVVTIIGKGFAIDPALNKVFFNGVAARVIKSGSDTLLVYAPTGGSSGVISIKVGPDQVIGGAFMYTNTSSFQINPSSGLNGTQISFFASNIPIDTGAAISIVFSGGKLGTVIYKDSHRIIALPPPGFISGPTTIQIGAKTYAGPIFSRFSLKSINPSAVLAGSTVTIKGTGFNPINIGNTVYFRCADPALPGSFLMDIPSQVIFSSPDSIILQVPILPSGVVSGKIKMIPNGIDSLIGLPYVVINVGIHTPLRIGYAFSAGFPILMQGSGFNPDLQKNQLSLGGEACKISYVSKTGDSIIYYLPDNNPFSAGKTRGTFVLKTGDQNVVIPYPIPTYTDPATFTPFPEFYFQEVTTLAGGTVGLLDGFGRAAQFKSLSGITLDINGNVYVTDREANNIRKISPTGTVSLFAGSPTGQSGYKDDYGVKALFNAPTGITITSNGDFYVADSGNFRIRKINANGLVSTFAGSGIQGNTDGSYSSAKFLGPNNIYYFQPGGPGNGSDELVYISDVSAGKGSIRQIDFAGLVINTLIPGLKSPKGIVYSGEQFDIQYIDTKNQTLVNHADNTILSGTLGVAGYFDNFFLGLKSKTPSILNNPSYVAGFKDQFGYGVNSYISDQGNNSIRYMIPFTDPTTFNTINRTYTFVGGGLSFVGNAVVSANKAGFIDGGFKTALFNKPGPMAVDAFGNIFVCDVGNHAIRKIILSP